MVMAKFMAPRSSMLLFEKLNLWMGWQLFPPIAVPSFRQKSLRAPTLDRPSSWRDFVDLTNCKSSSKMLCCRGISVMYRAVNHELCHRAVMIAGASLKSAAVIGLVLLQRGRAIMGKRLTAKRESEHLTPEGYDPMCLGMMPWWIGWTAEGQRCDSHKQAHKLAKRHHTARLSIEGPAWGQDHSHLYDQR